MEGKFGPIGVADARGQETGGESDRRPSAPAEGVHTSCVPGPPRGGGQVVHLLRCGPGLAVPFIVGTRVLCITLMDRE